MGTKNKTDNRQDRGVVETSVNESQFQGGGVTSETPETPENTGVPEDSDLQKSRLKMLQNVAKSEETPQNSYHEKTDVKAHRAGHVRPVVKLDAKGRAYFDAVVDYLDEKGLLETVDTLLLTMLAKTLSLWRQIVLQINTVDDLVQTFENGTSNVTGLQTAKDKAEATILKLSSKLGLSPQDRAKLFGAVNAANDARNKSAEGDELDRFL